MKYLIGVCIAAVSLAAQADNRWWKLLTITYGGDVHTSNAMSRTDCVFARHRVLGEPAAPQEIADAKKREAEREAEEERENKEAIAETLKSEHKDGWSVSDDPDGDIMVYHDMGLLGGKYFVVKDGRVISSSGESYTRAVGANDIKTAECFQ